MSKSNISVKARPGEDSERLVKRFCKKFKKLGIIELLRDRRYYKKPSVAKRLKREAAARERERTRRKMERNKRINK